MTHSKGTLSMIALLGLGAMAAVAVSAAAGSGHGEPQGSKDCRIISHRVGGMRQLEASFTAPATLTGQYEFSVTGSGSSGSSQISQGNAFRADRGETVTLGSVSLSPGKVYDVNLRIQSETGESWRCRETFEF